MYYQTAHDDAFVISSTTALGMGEHLLSLLDTLIQNLPESELREMRRGLNQSRALVDGLLCNIALSSPFDALTVSDVSTTFGINDSIGIAASSHSPGRASTRIPTNFAAPPSSPASVTNRDVIALRSPLFVSREAIAASRNIATERNKPAAPKYDVIISTRPRVGRPDYTHHPPLVQPGIPGPYSRPPVDPSRPDPIAYYIITKGLYVGIFCSWPECSPWVTGVTGNVHCKARQWDEARAVYNARLAAGACEVLA